MSTTTAAPAIHPMVAQLLQTLEMEHKTTMRVLGAVPADKLDYQPHERSWNAGKLAWHIAYSSCGLACFARTGSFEAYKEPPGPATLDEILKGAETFHQQTREELAQFSAERLQESIPLPKGRSIPVSGMLWNGVVFHQIHHRGQLSVYVRMMGGKVPSIYGPSADDNPFQ